MPNFLTKKIGPLPIWAYGAIAAGGTFLLLSGGGGGKKKDPNAAGGSTDNTTTGSANTNWKLNESINSDQTFGGGGIGFFNGPHMGRGHVFVNLMHHPDGGYFHGGRNYNAHAFHRHGWGGGGHHGGSSHGRGDDHRHGFGGGNDHHDGGGGPRRGGGDRNKRSRKPSRSGHGGKR